LNNDRVIVALDLETANDAVKLAEQVAPVFPFFKIGIRLFTQAGPDLIKQVRRYGELFLDLKFYDIPTIVAEAVGQAAKLGISLLTLHASGGTEMMKLCVEKVSGRSTRLLGVTVLTSFRDLREFGTERSLPEQAKLLADLAREAGMHGIVCSPLELADLRSRFSSPFLIVTPGIRSPQDQKGDQKRTATPREALAAGADYIVIGRPITAAQNPLAAAKAIADAIYSNE
jgi:orotidine-5'-phosphate decarboxylase